SRVALDLTIQGQKKGGLLHLGIRSPLKQKIKSILLTALDCFSLHMKQ
ncbi:hypothetical protein HMPREF1863_01218, partial [Aedoeadaptatus coxii]